MVTWMPCEKVGKLIPVPRKEVSRVLREGLPAGVHQVRSTPPGHVLVGVIPECVAEFFVPSSNRLTPNMPIATAPLPPRCLCLPAQVQRPVLREVDQILQNLPLPLTVQETARQLAQQWPSSVALSFQLPGRVAGVIVERVARAQGLKVNERDIVEASSLTYGQALDDPFPRAVQSTLDRLAPIPAGPRGFRKTSETWSARIAREEEKYEQKRATYVERQSPGRQSLHEAKLASLRERMRRYRQGQQ